MLLDFVFVFITGGIICLLGQILINFTKMTSARILVIFLLLGVVLEAIGIFKYIKEFGGSGATIPIVGFGSGLARGGIEGAKSNGFIGAISGGLSAISPGLATVIAVGFIVALITKPRSK